MPLLAVPAVALVYVLPRLILHYLIGRRQTLLRDQVAGAAVLLANSTRASLTLAQGIESAGREAPEPLALELRRIALEYQRGRPLSEALRDAQRRLNLDGFTLLASALLTCLDRGSNVSEALERISKSLLEHQRLERKLDADTASGRRVVLLLGAFPVLFLGFFSLLDPVAIARLFDGVLGQLVLVVVGLLVYVGVRWALRIMRLEV
jgi:tight adherence protein B